MRRHDAGNASGDRRSERSKFQGVESLPTRIQDREGNVRIGVGITVTGEVFCRREQTVIACAPDVCGEGWLDYC